jgi:non-specific serine/threonine protein kinase
MVVGLFPIPMLEIRLLGQFNLRQEGLPVEIPSRPAQTLLAYLLLNLGTSHRREKLAGLLWPDASEANSRSYLRKALWTLRKSIPPREEGMDEYFLADDLSIAFSEDTDYWLDTAVLDSELPASAPVEDMIAVVSAYGGDLLPGFYEEWVTLERERLRSTYSQKMSALLVKLVGECRWVQTVEWGERWIALGEAPEPAYRALMIAHANSGDMAKVAATYERCVEALREEVNVEPSAQTTELYERLRRGEGLADTEAAFTDRSQSSMPEFQSLESTPASRATNVTLPLTSFVGRQQEMEEVRQLISSSRLVTLTGPGGCGKTRLALQVGDTLVDEFSDGVWLIEFGSLTDPELVLREIALVLGVREEQERALMSVLLDHLRKKNHLLLFDSCEHVVEACAETAETFLRSCDQLRILATSREPLNVAGEATWIVPSLSFPGKDDQQSLDSLIDYDAVRLFVERAALRSVPSFELTEENAQTVVQVCRRLDGIPLALELAAARLKALTLEELASRLDDCFHLLTAGSRTALPRHQTLRATIDWSYDLLHGDEKVMLRQLSGFAGGWTLEDAEAICQPSPDAFLPSSQESSIQGENVVDLHSNLTEKSLVSMERKDGTARYRMLETVRDYAREKLGKSGEESAVRDRHLEIFMKFAEKAEPMLNSNEMIWLEQLDAELDNIRRATEWSLVAGKENDSADSVARVEAGLRTLSALPWYLDRRNRSEHIERLLQLLSLPAANRKTTWRSKALNAAGFLHWLSGEYDKAEALMLEALSISRELGDDRNVVWAVRSLGAVADFKGDYEAARSYLEESVRLARHMGTEGLFDVAWSLTFLGDVYLYHEELEEAESAYKEGLDLLRELGSQNVGAYGARRLGHLALRQGNLGEAAELFSESLLLNQAVGHRGGIAGSLTAFAGLASTTGNAVRASKLFGAADALLELIDIPLLHTDRIEHEHYFAEIRLRLGEEPIASAWAEGQAMSIDEAVAYALEPATGLN